MSEKTNNEIPEYPEWTPLKFCQMLPSNKMEAKVYGNSRYTVIVREVRDSELGILTHLSIHDHWRSSRHDWRDMQLIKSAILGPEAEAFEIYPPESKLVDSSNQFHLWAFSQFRHTDHIGFQERFVLEPCKITDEVLADFADLMGIKMPEGPSLARQRDFDAHTMPEEFR